MLAITMVFTVLQLLVAQASLPSCESVMQAKVKANPAAFLMQSPGHITEIARDGTPYGTDCRD